MGNVFNSIFYSIKAKKVLFTFLIILSLIAAVLATVSAVNLSGSVLPLDLSNIAFIKFLKGETGFAFLLTGTLVNLLLFYGIIFLFCSKKFLFPLAIVFYLYFVYSQVMIFVSIFLIYGFFNTLVLLLFLLVYYLTTFLILSLIVIYLSNICGAGYFKCCINKNESNLIFLTILLLAVSLIFCVIITILKSFVILLIY